MKKGFSLIELIVALGVSSIVMLTVISLMLTFMSSNTKSKRQEMFEQTKNDLQLELSNAVRWAKVVQINPENIVTDGKSYTLSGGQIYKDGEALTPTGVEVTRFDINNYSNDIDLVSVEIRIEMRDRSFVTARDGLRVVVSQRKTSIDAAAPEP